MRRLQRPQLRSRSYNLTDWKGKLTGYPAFVLGNGCSINDSDISLLSNYFTIGINRIFKTLDPTILFWQDASLFKEEESAIKSLKALKYCRDIVDVQRQFYNFHLKSGAYKFDKRTDLLCGSGSSGPLAVELAVAMGCGSVVILGMDCQLGPQGLTDFYGNNSHHYGNDKKGTLPQCIKGLEFIKRECAVPIVSCSKNNYFEFIPLPEAIEKVDPEHKCALGREKYVSMILG